MTIGPGADSTDSTELSTWSPQAHAARGVFTIAIEGVTHSFDISQSATVGTALGNLVRIIHPTVSRIHAEFRASGHGIWLRDLDSTNGCRVNGLLTKEALLPDGALLGFGDVEGRFEYADPASVPVALTGRFGDMLGVSNSMRRLFLVLEQCARVDAPVLLTGEQGSGKSLAARSIHALSAHAGAPFLSVDCAALPAEATVDWILRSVHSHAPFFAPEATKGNDPGTLVFEEIGELSLQVQAKLVRFLEGKGPADGGERLVQGARLVSTTQRDLRELVNRGAFREDLYFRIAVVPVELPPLRHRVEDIPLLARHFLGRAPWPAELSLDQMQQQPWIGNVRELKNCVERARRSSQPSTASPIPESLDFTLGDLAHHDGRSSKHQTDLPDDFGDLPNTKQPLRSFREQWTDAGEQRYLQALLASTNNNVPAAARLAQVDRTYIYRLIRRHRR